MEPDDGLLRICTPTPSVNPDGSAQVFRPEWRTETVVGLANGIADDRAFERMPILADALEEAGCDLMSVLLHCREPIAHEGGCWVLEQILCRIPPLTSPEGDAHFWELVRAAREPLPDAREPLPFTPVPVPQGCFGGGCVVFLVVAAILWLVKQFR